MEGVFISNSLKDKKKYNFIVVFYLMENPQKPGISAALAQAQQWIKIADFCLRIFLQQRVFTWHKYKDIKSKTILFCLCLCLCCARPLLPLCLWFCELIS